MVKRSKRRRVLWDNSRKKTTASIRVGSRCSASVVKNRALNILATSLLAIHLGQRVSSTLRMSSSNLRAKTRRRSWRKARRETTTLRITRRIWVSLTMNLLINRSTGSGQRPPISLKDIRREFRTSNLKNQLIRPKGDTNSMMNRLRNGILISLEASRPSSTGTCRIWILGRRKKSTRRSKQ